MLNKIMNTAFTGAKASEIQLTVASNNIANINTPNYRREVVNQADSLYYGINNLTFGTGTKITSITQVNNFPLFQQEINSQSNTEYQTTLKDNLIEFNNSFQLNNSNSLNSVLSKIDTAIQDLTVDPANKDKKQVLLDSFNNLADTINLTTTEYDSQQSKLTKEITAQQSQADSIISQIGQLNYNITHSPNSAFDLINQRDNLLNDLSKFIPVTYDSKENLLTSNGSALLLKDKPITSVTSLSNTTTSGSLAGLISSKSELESTHNSIISNFKAYTSKINEVHTSGTTIDNTSGNTVFTWTDDNVELNLNNVNDLAVGKSSSNLDNKNILELQQGLSSLNTVSNLSLEFSKLSSAISQHTSLEQMSNSIYTSLNTERRNIEGVNQDEELLASVQAQRAYEANMKVIATANSMWDALLSIKS